MSNAGEKRILVVDDEQIVRMILQDILRSRGDYQVATAGSGAEALAVAAKSPPDLLITDIRLPVMDGVQLTEAMRKRFPATKVIWITAHGSLQMAPDRDRLGVFCCLDKPVEAHEIRAVVSSALA